MKNIHLINANRPPTKGDLLLRHLWKGHKNECKSFWVYKSTVTIENVEQYVAKFGSFRDEVGSFEVKNVYITNGEDIKAKNYILVIREGLLIGKQGDIVYINSTKEGRTDYTRMDGTKGWFASDVNYQKDWNYKKIILCTDPKLIADGVQSIDDEFLDWISKNSGCEFVEIENTYNQEVYACKEVCEFKQCHSFFECKYVDENDLSKTYKIIIPKESFEPKPKTYDLTNGITISDKLFKESLLEAAKWGSQATEYEKSHITLSEARERVVNRIFDKYKKL